MLEQMQMLHIHPMIIITFVTVCEMKWSRIKSGIIGTLNIFPLLPPEPRNNSNQGWESGIQHSCICELWKYLKLDLEKAFIFVSVKCLLLQKSKSEISSLIINDQKCRFKMSTLLFNVSPLRPQALLSPSTRKYVPVHFYRRWGVGGRGVPEINSTPSTRKICRACLVALSTCKYAPVHFFRPATDSRWSKIELKPRDNVAATSKKATSKNPAGHR